jgi:hypothetical protein
VSGLYGIFLFKTPVKFPEKPSTAGDPKGQQKTTESARPTLVFFIAIESFPENRQIP